MPNKSNEATARSKEFKESILRGFGVVLALSGIIYLSPPGFQILCGGSFLAILGLGLLFHAISIARARAGAKETSGKTESK